MKIVSRSVSHTLKVGTLLGRLVQPGDILCLYGQLGTGKTALVKGIARGLGIGPEGIISPTFILIRAHTQARLPLYHFDLYRLNGQSQIMALGYEEYFYGEGVTVIEWAERLGNLLPKGFLKIELSHRGKTTRGFSFSAFGTRSVQLLASFGNAYKKATP